MFNKKPFVQLLWVTDTLTTGRFTGLPYVYVFVESEMSRPRLTL